MDIIFIVTLTFAITAVIFGVLWAVTRHNWMMVVAALLAGSALIVTLIEAYFVAIR